MSRIITLAALALATSTSFALAGGPAAVAVEPAVAPAAVATGGLGTIGIIAGVVLVAAAVGLGNDETTTTGTTN